MNACSRSRPTQRARSVRLARSLSLALSVTAGLLLTAPAGATEPPQPQVHPDDQPDPAPKEEKNEIAGAPILGGNTDIGFQIGLAATLTRVSPHYRPYRWKMDGLLSASVKGGPRGTEVVQQSHDLRLDIPRAVSGKIRVLPGIFFERTVNAGYFGVGNDSQAVAKADGTFGNRYQYVHNEIRARVNLRSPLEGPFSVMYGLTLRYVNPGAYPGSRLDEDASRKDEHGAPIIRGLQPLGHTIGAVGLLVDTRDNEITPTKGTFDLFALRGGFATPTESQVRYGGLNAVIRRYVPFGGRFVFATRFFADLMFGDVAFYDLSQGGAFIPLDLPGGAQGIRGVPNGRYQGLIKLVGNVELRATHLRFRLFGDDFRVGNNIFFDAGRVYAGYRADERDGHGFGLKYGVGAGVFVVWGTAAVFRVEFAYSPDAIAANPGFPIGIYAADGQMF